MTREEFQNQFGLSPEKCKELMETVANLVTYEVQEAIAHADFYINPLDYCDKKTLKELYGEDCFDKDEDEDGYIGLYDFKVSNTAARTFQNLISNHTYYGGYTSAIEAIDLMDLHWRDGT